MVKATPARPRLHGAFGAAVLVIRPLLLIPPHGILSENEENYFALAERFIGGTAWPQETAVFDASRHRMLSDATLGALVSTIGYAPAQVVTRLLIVAAFILVLPPLFGVFALTALDTAVVIMTMALIGQDIVGGEWIFSGYEAKVAAYILVLAALRRVLTREQLGAATLLLALATYFHFLVGGFWFTAGMVLRLLDRPRAGRDVLAAVAVYGLLVAPLCSIIIWSRLADASAALAPDVPPPDVIYSIIREPHHQSPFLTWSYFKDRWLPGYIMAVPMLLFSVWLARNGAKPRLRVMAVWLAGLVAYLFLVLGPKFLDRDSGVLWQVLSVPPLVANRVTMADGSLGIRDRTCGASCAATACGTFRNHRNHVPLRRKRAFGKRDRHKQRQQDAESSPGIGCNSADSTR